jgi:uncharacterized protein YndB with AHSA1/START domain
MWYMKNIQKITATATTRASAETVFALVADTESWSRWAAFDSAMLEHPGSPDRQGVGAVRRLTKGRVKNREEVVAYEPPHKFAYKLLEGLPLDDYLAEVTITRTGTVTTITWTSTFHMKGLRPAWPYRLALGRFIADTVRRLAKASEVGADSIG